MSPKSPGSLGKKRQQQLSQQESSQQYNRSSMQNSSNSKAGKKSKEDLQQTANCAQQGQQPSQTRPPSADALQRNKENLNSSLSKIFFNSPRAQGSKAPGPEAGSANGYTSPSQSSATLKEKEKNISLLNNSGLNGNNAISPAMMNSN